MSESVVAEELLGQLEALPWGARHREVASEIVAAAQERGDEDLEFAARMRLTTDGVMTGHTDLALANFAWCAAKHSQDPARFVGGDPGADSFFWQYKWMPGLLRKSPVFERAQIMDVLDDFEATFKAAGLPLSAVTTARFESAIHLGNLAEAERRGAELEKMPTDPYSSCDACVPSDYVDLELLRGDLAAAADRAVGMWRAGEMCGEEPESALASVLIALAKLGRNDDAKEAFEYAYEQSKGDPDNLANVAECAAFASVTGNHAIAFAMVERHLAWLPHDPLGEAARPWHLHDRVARPEPDRRDRHAELARALRGCRHLHLAGRLGAVREEEHRAGRALVLAGRRLAVLARDRELRGADDPRVVGGEALRVRRDGVGERLAGA